MANTRKVLINLHSTKNQAPEVSQVYQGELVVSHPEGLTGLSATTIWTRNNDTMVPFASCAMTKQMIDNAIQEADVTYDVKAATNDKHVEVATAGTKEKVFTVSSKDVMSEEEFKTYSANTAAAIAELLDVVLTGVTGDDIILATLNNPTGASNTVSLTHKTGDVASGFNKLTTDAYGHVTAHTAVAASDIKALGFEDSAWTEAKITEEINKLDSEAKVSAANKYLTGVAIADGKISGFTEAELPVLSTAKTGTGNVVSDITVNGHQITYATVSVATSEDIADLSAATINLSAATTAISEDLEILSGIVETFSAATVAEFNSAFTAIQGMDKAADVVAGQVVTTVAQTDGKVTETKANVKDLQLGGYSKDTTATGAIAGTDTINTALSKLENIVAANAISNADGSINVTTASTGTDINVNIKSGEHVLAKDGNAGLYTDLDLVKITTGLPETIKERYQLLATDDSQIGVNIDVPKDSHIVSITYDETTQKLIYEYLDASGATKTTEVDMAHLILETEVENGIQSVNGKLSIKLDTTGDDTGDGKFLTVGADGLKLDGVTDAINAAIDSLDVTGDTAVAGQYVAAIEETDGLVAVKTRANVSEAVLNNYAKGTDDSAVVATDTVNGAISKLENQIDKAKAAATTKVVEGTDAGNNMTIVPTTGNDNSVTYTVNLTDVASKDALDAEIAARKAVDGQTGQTYAANTGTTYITGATSLNDADVKLDAALKAVSDKVSAAKVTEGSSVENFVALALDTATTAGTTALTIDDSRLKTEIDEINSAITAETKARQDAIADLDSSTATTDSGHYITAITITDGKITAAGQEALPAATPVTTANGTTGDTVAPVLTGITPGGTEGHALTLNYTNKVLSAQTADEAAHASAATKVDQKLTFADDANDVEYDGSQAKTITFGTDVTSTGITGRSMSITNGVVDVDIIDCGEY